MASAPPPIPTSAEGFTPDWALAVMTKWFEKNDKSIDTVKINRVDAKTNPEQGLLSTTFIVDVFFSEDGNDEEKKSIFVKVPLTGDSSKNFKQVNVRENEMYTNVLPVLQQCLDENCTGFFCLGFPEVVYCHYSGDECHDAFITENLMDLGFMTCKTDDLKLDTNGKDFLKASLETLSQLHGTGLYFKKSLGGSKGVLDKFPEIQEQIQIRKQCPACKSNIEFASY